MKNNTIPYRTTFLEEFAKSSWDYFQQIGYPNSKIEEWRFSNPNPWILSNTFHKIKQDSFLFHKDKKDLSIEIYENKIRIPENLPDGLEIFDMFQAMEKNILIGSIGSVQDYHDSAFSAENMALFNNGIIIYLNENIKLDTPLKIIHKISDNDRFQPFPRIYLNVGKNSNLEIIETQFGNNNIKNYINSVIEVVVHENATLDWTLLQNFSFNIGHISSFNLALEKNTNIKYNFYDLGGGFIRRNINVDFFDSGSNLDLNGLFTLSEKQHVDIFSKVNHKAPKCTSNQLIKGVLSDTASGVFRGLAYVENKAKKTNANQANHNLLLSSKSKINSIPILEIYEDDVKCSHGSTTGQIDQEAIFYLQSRGLNKNDAIQLIVKGFMDEILNKIKNDDFKKIVLKNIMEKQI